eukprot:351227-Chlamydomonas_euryale.AAC.2
MHLPWARDATLLARVSVKLVSEPYFQVVCEPGRRDDMCDRAARSRTRKPRPAPSPGLPDSSHAPLADSPRRIALNRV